VSVFLDKPRDTWLAENTLAFAIPDGYPVSAGHTLVIPKRPVPTWFEATEAERHALMALVEEVKALLDASHQPDGYNIGINIGAAAGQTVMHLHVHVIPRYVGDVPDPRGGVRHVMPGRGNYLVDRPPPLTTDLVDRPPPLTTGGKDDPFLRQLRPLLRQADEIDILAAFVQDAGLLLLDSELRQARRRGARIRLLTGDYLHITQEKALTRLLDWASEPEPVEGRPEQLDLLDALDGAPTPTSAPHSPAGTFATRVVETSSLPTTSHSFHPKSWVFVGPDVADAFVGSSNISRAALGDGIEWNLRVERGRDPFAFERIRQAFALWWTRGRPLDQAWVDQYRQAVSASADPLPPGEADAEPVAAPPEPYGVQLDALAELAASRQEGRQRALVVMATGLGKTWLAAFDVRAFAEERERQPRVLFVAHRRELLSQAAGTFRRCFANASIGFHVGAKSNLEADFVFASVQKIGRAANLAALDPAAFDYVIIDEAHHVHARTYRRLVDRLQPAFLLGLTATPDRADAADILGLFDDHLAFRADLGVGIEAGHLAPFSYFGIADTTDYKPIPWRNRRFDPSELADAVQTQARMEKLWQSWGEHPGSRTLVFCCSIAHAKFATDWLLERGVNCACVHSGPDSDDRDVAIEALQQGELEAVCSVDLFNEGVDVPAVDRVVMLRPTESPVVFLQQLGRGLRVARDKAKLTVIDFVGNHRVFLDRVRTLLNTLAPQAESPSLAALLGVGQLALPGGGLPAGCSIDIELEAIDLLRKLLPSGARNALVRTYRELKASRGRRPSAGELFRRGLNPGSVRSGGGAGWLRFVGDEGDLSEDAAALLVEAGTWFRDLETTAMSRSYKMVTLLALAEADALTTGLAIDELCQRSHRILLRSPELLGDLDSVRELPDPAAPDPAVWQRYWRKNPLHFWSDEAKKRGRAWFRIDGDRFVPRYKVDSKHEAVFAELTLELVDWRLAQYRRSRRRIRLAAGRAFECRLFHNDRGAIIKLPERARMPWIPQGEMDARLPDDSWWRFRFAKIAINVARPVGARRNELPELLKSWFGADAGQPGTTHHVRFVPTPDGWCCEPVQEGEARVVPLVPRRSIPCWPDLRAAAGWAGTERDGASLEPSTVRLPVQGTSDCFAVRASGESMAGWRSELRDGDWLVMTPLVDVELAAAEGQVALVERGDELDQSWHVKRVVRRGARWWLASDNPQTPAVPALPGDRPVAVLKEVIRPEDLAPEPGSHIDEGGIAVGFHVGAEPAGAWERIDGHLFILLEGRESMTAPTAVPIAVPVRRPGETAFVLGRAGPAQPWQVLGVGRWSEDAAVWLVPEVDFAAWRALGRGRSSSRQLGEAWQAGARDFVAALLAVHQPDVAVELGNRRLRIRGRSARGGVRIDGGEGGFTERTVSLLDIGWALAAREDVILRGGVLEEARLNRLRYLQGTPRVSTRWIDSGWAIRLVLSMDESECGDAET